MALEGRRRGVRAQGHPLRAVLRGRLRPARGLLARRLRHAAQPRLHQPRARGRAMALPVDGAAAAARAGTGCGRRSAGSVVFVHP